LTSANRARAVGMTAALLASAACTDWAGYDLDRASGAVPAFSTMRDDVVPDPYQMVREPVPGTVPAINPMGDVPAPYTQAQLDSVAPTLVNPLRPTPEVLSRGERVFATNCAVCHGADGAGNGPVVNAQTKFPFAPAINGGATAGRSDGYIYAVIDAGRNFMPPYGTRIPHLDRWAVVTYLRRLQAASGAAAQPERGAPAPPVTPDAVMDTARGAEPAPAAGAPPATLQNRPSSTVP
jgi:mono/diheme cytochrome c family protein